MASPTIDTPDYQRGVVSAQVLLASAANSNYALTVGVPPNAESIIVAFEDQNVGIPVSCTGVTSGANYAGALAAKSSQTLSSTTFFFDVSSAVDSEVTVTAHGIGGGPWSIYADSGVHLTADIATARDPSGRLVPFGPTLSTGEIAWGSNPTNLIAGGDVCIFGWTFQNNTAVGTQELCVLIADGVQIDELSSTATSGGAAVSSNFPAPFFASGGSNVQFSLFGPGAPSGKVVLRYGPQP